MMDAARRPESRPAIRSRPRAAPPAPRVAGAGARRAGDPGRSRCARCGRAASTWPRRAGGPATSPAPARRRSPHLTDEEGPLLALVVAAEAAAARGRPTEARRLAEQGDGGRAARSMPSSRACPAPRLAAGSDRAAAGADDDVRCADAGAISAARRRSAAARRRGRLPPGQRRATRREPADPGPSEAATRRRRAVGG